LAADAYDSKRDFAIDRFVFKPKLVCTYPCQLCGKTKDYCTKCWQVADPNPFLMVLSDSQTCKAKCDDGYSTNGNPAKKCQQCADSCATCVDNSKAGDLSKCLTCAPSFPFTTPKLTTEQKWRSCHITCPVAMYQVDGTNECEPCDKSCKTCSGPAATQCTSCFPRVDPPLPNALPVKLVDQCVAKCPVGTSEVGGVCEKCESPC
jgi:proprotein convertase subtilisin/kexin type 5